MTTDNQIPVAPATASSKKPALTTYTKEEKLLSALGYISFLCVLPLTLRRDSKFCQHHGKQGLAIAVFFYLIGFVTMWAGWLTVIFGLIHAVIAIYGIISAFGGKKAILPVISAAIKKINI